MVRRLLAYTIGLWGILLLLLSLSLAAGVWLTDSVVAMYIGECSDRSTVLCAVDVRRGLVLQRTDIPFQNGRWNWLRDRQQAVFSTDFPGDILMYDGAKTHNMTDDEIHNASPVLSPDGERLAYIDTENDSGSRVTLKVMNIHDRSLLELPTPQGGNYRSPLWSPDGSAILYMTSLVNNSTQVWRISLDGSEPVRLGVAMGNYVAWSPDGQQVAHIGPDSARIFISDAHTGDTVASYRPMENRGEINQMAWSPDGERLAFIAYDNGANTATVLHLSSGKVRQLHHLPYQSWQTRPLWFDERYIVQWAFTIQAGGLDYGILLLDSQSEWVHIVELTLVEALIGLVEW